MPTRKDRPKRQIDDKAISQIGDGEIITQSVSVAGSAIHLPQSIDTLEFIDQAVFRSAATPTIVVNIGWQHPDGEIPQDYIVQYAENDTFTLNKESFIAYGLTASLYLKPDTDYWIRIAPRIRTIQSDWSNVLNITTIEDTLIPSDVTNVTGEFENSNLIISWDQPNDEAYKNARIRIWNATGTVLYNTYWQRESPFILTAAENRRIGLGTPLTSVLVDVTSNSWGNTSGASVEIVSVVAPIPGTPSGIAHSWQSDDGTADEDLTIQWSTVTNANDYILTLDSKNITTKTPFVIYPYFNNKADHTPTLSSGDYALSYSIIARDLLDQQSVAATGTATNMAPPNAFGTVQATGGFSSLGITVTPSTNILDFDHYEFSVLNGVTTVSSFTSPDNIQTVSLNSAGTYDVSVKAVDKYDRKSTAVVASGIYVDALTIDELRAETSYSDSVSTSPTTLNGLKDGDLTTTVVTYGSSSVFRWTQASRPQLDRYKPITLSISATNTSFYFATSADGSTWRWFAGPLAATGTTGQNTTLVEYANQSLADTNSFLKSSGVYRFDLPSLIEARYIIIFHKNASGAYSFREFYPRRVIQSDDIQAEDIKGINIAASTINAGHISVTTLSAIQTSTGTLTINTNGYIRSGMTAYATGTGFYLGNDSGTTKFSIGNGSGTYFAWDGTNLVLTGSNFTIQTASSAQRIVIDSNGVSGYNSSGTLQVRIQSSDGKISAGAGAVIIDANGISITQGQNDANKIKWYVSSTLLSSIYAYQDTDLLRNKTTIVGEAISGYHTRIDLDVFSVSGKTSTVRFSANQSGAGTGPSLSIVHTSSSVKEVNIDNATLNLSGSMTITGSITTESVIAPTLLNSWVNYGSGFENAGYWKDAFGYVHLRGLVKNGTITAAIFTLPAAYRPSNAQIFATVANDAFARVTIDTAGNVQATVGSNAFFSLNGISFRV